MASYLDDEKESALSPKQKKAEDFLKRFECALEAHEQWLTEKRKCEDFYDGIQWTGEEVSRLEERAQPVITVNKIKTQIDLVVGLEQRFRQRIRAIHRNESENDALSADAISEAFRYVDQRNSVEFQGLEVFEDGLIGGRGWFFVGIELDEDLEKEIVIQPVPSSDIVLDEDSRAYDLKDAKDLFHTAWYSEDDLVSLYPKKERTIRKALVALSDPGVFKNVYTYRTLGDKYLKSLENDQGRRNIYFDERKNRMRLINHYKKVYERRRIFMHPDIGMGIFPTDVTKDEAEAFAKKIEKETGVAPVLEDKATEVVKICSYLGKELLEEKDSPFLHNRFPFVQYRVNYEKKKARPYGLVRQAIDQQVEINKRRSKALHLLNTQRVIAEEGAINDPEKARKEMARPDSWIEVNRGFEFRVESNSELGSAQLQLYQSSMQEIQEVMGVTRELVGLTTNARTGKAIDRRIEQGLAVLSKVFSNWRRTKLLVAEHVLSLMQQYWTEEKAVRVLDDQQQVKFLHLNEKRVVDGKEIIFRNIATGKYDVIFDEADMNVNIGEDIFAELAKMAQTGAIPPDIVMEFAPIPFSLKQKILGRLRPQPQPTSEGTQQGTPEISGAALPNEAEALTPEQIQALQAEGLQAEA